MMLSFLPSMMLAHAVISPPTLTPATSGVKGDTIVVKGPTGEIPAGTTVQLYWDDSTIAWNGIKGLLNSTTAAADGSYDVWFNVPEAVTGSHYIWIRTTLGGIADVTYALFSVNPYVKLSPSSGLVGDTITVKMYGFPGSGGISVDFAGKTGIATPTANSIGSASATFKVPTGAVTGPVTATNTTSAVPPVVTTASATFTVGPVITLSATSGTVGQVITITGRGFTSLAQIVQGAVSIINTDTLVSVPCYITTTLPLTVDSTQRIRLNIVIPQVAKTSSDYSIAITGAAGSASADFEVTALATVSVTPEYGPVASSMTVSGTNFPKISGVEVTVTVGGVSAGTVDTLSDGTFSKVFKVPAQTEGTYPLVAYTTLAYGITNAVVNTKNFKVGTMNIILSDDHGATGTTISISGNGFAHSGAWNATFGSTTIESGVTADINGIVSGTFQVPQLPVGTYTITAWDIPDSISLTTQFSITQTTSVTLNVPSAPNGFNVTFRGYGFGDSDQAAAAFVIYNKTSTGATDFFYTITVIQSPWETSTSPAYANTSGEIYGWWKVDPSSILSKGKYYVNVTDASGNYEVTVPFAIGSVQAVCTPRKPSFMIGETVSFVIQHSFGGLKGSVADGSYLRIYDTNGTLQFSGDALKYTTWVKTGNYYTEPYSGQTAGGNPMVLQDDAPTGTWTYKWFDNTDTLITSGTFTVVASATSALETQVAGLSQQLTDLKNQVTGVTTAVQGIQTAATAAQTTATAAQTSAAAAKTSADAALAAATTAGTNANAATTAANAAKTSADNAAAAVNNLTTLVYGAIGASLVAALAAIVALMQISRKIA